MINQRRLIQIFFDLVRIDSPTGREREVGDFVLEILREIGIEAERDKVGNIIVRLPGTGEPLFFNAHLDTVQPGEGIRPKIRNGIITSDGTTILGADNKALIAAILEALRWLRSNRTQPLEIVFTVSEESGNLGALNLDYTTLRSRYGFCFDCGERLGTIILASPFYNRLDILVKGRPSHAAFLQQGINALEITSDSISKLRLGQLDEFTIFNIGVIQGGSARNVVPGEIRLSGEIRSFREERLGRYERRIQQIFESTASPAGSEVRIDIVRENDGYDFERSDPWVREVARILRELGFRTRHTNTWTCSDANIFNAKGIKVLNLGDGIKNIHSCKENIRIEDLVNLTRLIIRLAQNFSCG